jgi:hypothetical protein
MAFGSMDRDAPTLRALRKHRAQQAKQRLQAGAAWHNSDYVFSRTLGVSGVSELPRQ